MEQYQRELAQVRLGGYSKFAQLADTGVHRLRLSPFPKRMTTFRLLASLTNSSSHCRSLVTCLSIHPPVIILFQYNTAVHLLDS